MDSHAVQLFDTSHSLALAVSAFVRDALTYDEAALLVVTPPHWEAICRCCQDDGVNLDIPLASGRLVVRDADRVLGEVMYRELPEWHRFDAAVGTLIRNLRAEFGAVRVYGEAVDLLVRRNQFEAAETLEGLWNRLGGLLPFRLFCGYAAEHFGNPRNGGSLRRICDLHTHVHAGPDDVLGSFLLKTHAAC